MSDEKYWIEREDGTRMHPNPIDTVNDAHLVRYWMEHAYSPETFWIRSELESSENRRRAMSGSQ